MAETDVADPVIATERISRRFGSIQAVHEVSLTRALAGSIFGLIGPTAPARRPR